MKSAAVELELPDAAWHRRVRRAVLNWFPRHGRKLPWREELSAYRVWVSEIMLQQTQVSTVERYFARFIATFPDVRSLAAADEADVLKQWEGLGYYRRARSMHAAAREVVARFGGELPRDVEQLQSLPGVGRYTAGAIVSIAWDQPAPIVEANTLRLLSRLVGLDVPAQSGIGQRALWRVATGLLGPSRSRDLTLGLMDVGSTVCTPREPDCERCPLRVECRARATGSQDSIPVAAGGVSVTPLQQTAVVVERRGRVLLVQRQPGEWWSGLWDFPRYDRADQEALRQRIAEELGLRVTWGEAFMELRHAVTRYRISVDCHRVRATGGRLSSERPAQWCAVSDLDRWPLTAPARRIARRLTDSSPRAS
ncbi:MAG: A/G-specific adenine glycosylase [Pirellulales bacterium]